MNAVPAFPSACVIDASVLIKIALVEPDSDLVRVLLRPTKLDRRGIPDLAYLECASILWLRTRRGLLPPDNARSSFRDLLALTLTVHPTASLLPAILESALAYGTSAYDATYVTLAESLGVPLITADAALIRQTGGSKIRVLDLASFRAP